MIAIVVLGRTDEYISCVFSHSFKVLLGAIRVNFTGVSPDVCVTCGCLQVWMLVSELTTRAQDQHLWFCLLVVTWLFSLTFLIYVAWQ